MMTNEQILDTLKGSSIEETASILVEELNGVTTGAKVAVIDDDSTYPYSGLAGRVVGPVPGRAGHVDVEFANGAKVPVQVNQLVPVPTENPVDRG